MGSARDAPPPRLHGLTARRQVVCSAVGLGSSTARRAAGSGSSSRWCTELLGVGRPTRMGPTSTAPGCGLCSRRNPIPAAAAAPWPVPAGPCHRVRPPDPRWEATSRATHDGTAGPRARARGRRKDYHRRQRLSIAGRYHLAPLTLTRNAHSLDCVTTRLTPTFSAARHHSPERSRAEETDIVF